VSTELKAFSQESDMQRLLGWLRLPHVAEWWGDAREELRANLTRSPDTNALIVEDGVPVGFLCWGRPPQSELEGAALTDLPEDLVDVDIMIGEPDALGRGVGPRALGLLLHRLKADASVAFVGIGTAISNERAIRAYEKAGFRPFREFCDPDWGSCLYMVVDMRSAG